MTPDVASTSPAPTTGPPAASADGTGAATRVVTYSVMPGCEEEFRTWQHRINEVSAGFPGFQGLEIIPPADGSPTNQWTTLYRYGTGAQLDAWMGSEERQRALAGAPDVLDGAPSEYTMSGSESADHGETIVASHTVIPGKEDEYRAALDDLNRAAARFPGFSGVKVYDGEEGTNEVTVLIQFDSRDHMQAWLDSPERAAGRKRMYAATSAHHHKVVATGFGSWFAVNAVDGVAAPSWKQAMVVLSALFPTVMILNMTVGKLLEDNNVGMAPSVFVGNALGTVALTWLMMPIYARAMDWFLSPRCTGRRTALGIAVLLVVYAVEVVVFSLLNP